jgi:uncharacterized protein
MSTKKQTQLRFESLADLGTPGWWRYLLSFVCISIGSIVVSLPFVITMIVTGIDWKALSEAMKSSPEEGQKIIDEAVTKLSNGTFGSATNTLLLLAASGATVFVIWLTIKWVHKRAFLSVITNRAKFSWSRVWTGFWTYTAATLAILLIGILIGTALGQSNTIIWSNVNWGNFLLFLVLAIPLLFLQVASEEILFRGYIFQSVYKSVNVLQHNFSPEKKPALTISLIVSGIVSVLLFGLAHFQNGPFQAGIWVASGYFLTAILFQWITYKDQRLELSIGAHWANNLLAFAFIGSTLDGGTTSLFTDTATAVATNTPWTVVGILIPFGLFYWLVFTVLPKLTKKPNNV